MKLISSLNREGGGWLPGGVQGPLQGLAAGTQHSHTRCSTSVYPQEDKGMMMPIQNNTDTDLNTEGYGRDKTDKFW